MAVDLVLLGSLAAIIAVTGHKPAPTPPPAGATAEATDDKGQPVTLVNDGAAVDVEPSTSNDAATSTPVLPHADAIGDAKAALARGEISLDEARSRAGEGRPKCTACSGHDTPRAPASAPTPVAAAPSTTPAAASVQQLSTYYAGLAKAPRAYQGRLLADLGPSIGARW